MTTSKSSSKRNFFFHPIRFLSFFVLLSRMSLSWQPKKNKQTNKHWEKQIILPFFLFVCFCVNIFMIGFFYSISVWFGFHRIPFDSSVSALVVVNLIEICFKKNDLINRKTVVLFFVFSIHVSFVFCCFWHFESDKISNQD